MTIKEKIAAWLKVRRDSRFRAEFPLKDRDKLIPFSADDRSMAQAMDLVKPARNDYAASAMASRMYASAHQESALELLDHLTEQKLAIDDALTPKPKLKLKLPKLTPFQIAIRKL